MPFLRMPEGTRCRTVFLPPITKVCPALCPPWKRTTPWAWSVSQSTTLPLPSSPHWVPMTTTFLATVSALAQIAHGPLSGAFYELALAFGSIALRRVSRKRGHDNLPRGSQLADRRGEERVVGARRTNGRRLRFARLLRHGVSPRAPGGRPLPHRRSDNSRLGRGPAPAVPANRAEHGDVADIEARPGNTACGERVDEKLLDLQIALDSGVAVDFCADLQRLPGRVESPRPGEQNASRITQPRDAFPVQKMRIDPRDLRRDVGAHAHHPPGKLIDQLEGANIQIMSRARQQRFEVLEHGGNHQLVPVHAEQFEQLRAHPLDALRLRRQEVLEIFREEPVAHRGGLGRPSGGKTGSAGRPTSRKARKNGSVRQ